MYTSVWYSAHRGQRPTYRSQFPPSGLWVQGLNTGCQALRQVPWPVVILSALFFEFDFFPSRGHFSSDWTTPSFFFLSVYLRADVFHVCLFCSHLGGHACFDQLQTLCLRIRLRYYQSSPTFSYTTPAGKKFWFLYRRDYSTVSFFLFAGRNWINETKLLSLSCSRSDIRSYVVRKVG